MVVNYNWAVLALNNSYANTEIAKRKYRNPPVSTLSEEIMFTRSMMLICALGFAGCVDAADTADNQTGSVEQHTGGGGLFDCQNKSSISGVQCLFVPINVDVKNVSVLDGNKLTILSNDLNDIDVSNINILNYSSILSDLVDVSKNDFLNKFNINVAPNDTCAGVVILGLQHVLCK